MNTPFSTELQSFLSGRALLESELPFPRSLLDEHVAQGLVQKIPGMEAGPRCRRCANTTQRLFATFPCAHCQKECRYCRKCIMMGRVSSCTPLFIWTGPPPVKPISPPVLHWEGELSPGQATASDAVRTSVKKKTEMLVWAVCGAGKTEVLFAGIAEALEAGERVCIATPRTDVVLELAPRFKKVFPNTEVAALYGGSEDRHVYAPLVVATTHQLLRFEKAFDTVVVDEVDAFPYTMDESLQWAVEKAAKAGAAKVFLTATPSRKWQEECRTGKRPHVKIPARFHRYPLPVPDFKWCGDWRKDLEKGRIPAKLQRWVEARLQMNKQALLFFPDVELMENSLALFLKLHPAIESVHAADPDRKEKVAKMRAKQTPILLTTTILERGVTFPDIDVAVLGAEDDTFTEAALVQIAGRVGRSPDFPTGEIILFHYGRTRAMIQALMHIDNMNKAARKEGLID